jgi:hypothetical protein
LNGLTPVAVPGEWLRVNNMVMVTVGSGEFNAGNVVLRVVVGGAVLAHMPVGKGRAQQAVYTVPAEKELYSVFTKVRIVRAAPAAQVAEMELRARTAGGGWIARILTQVGTQGTGVDETNPPGPPLFAPKTDIQWVVLGVSANDTAVNGTLQGLLVDL